jgi:soluble lytic murein transglycosylase-like protein
VFVGVIFLYSFFLFASNSYAKVDLEIAESHQCSNLFPYFEKKFSIPTNTLHSIALKESGKKHTKHKIVLVWPWTVNVEGKGYYFDSKKEAIIFVKKQIMKGKENIDVGCMQINLKHHIDAFSSLAEAFNPRENIEYGARFLKSKYEQLGEWHKAVAHYHSATPALGLHYKKQVIKIASNMDDYKNSLSMYTGNNNHVTYPVGNYNEQAISSTKKVRVTDKKNMRKYKSNIMVMIPNTKLRN